MAVGSDHRYLGAPAYPWCPVRHAALLLLLLLASTSSAQSVVAVRGGRVLPIDGPELAEGTVLIVDGKVSKVGPVKDVQVPYDATVIDARGKVVIPGWVLAHTSAGLDRGNEGLPVMPFLEAGDAIDPSSLFFEDALRDGVTTVHVIQAEACLIGGTGRVLRPIGLTPDQMTVRAPSGLKLSFGGLTAAGGWDPMRERARLREAFADLDDWLDGLAERRYEEEEKKAGREVKVPPEKARELGRALIRAEDLDDAHRNLHALTRGKLDAFVFVAGAKDVEPAAALALEHGFLERTTFVLGGDAWKAAEVLKATGRPVVVGPALVHREADPVTGETKETFIPKALHDAGLTFALLTDPGASMGERFPWWQAARCVRAGIPRAVALRAVTTEAARACGVADRKGALAPGKDGDLLLLTGDPLSARSQVESVVLGGELVYERSRDFRLRRLVTGKDEPRPEKPTPGGPTPGEGEQGGE